MGPLRYSAIVACVAWTPGRFGTGSYLPCFHHNGTVCIYVGDIPNRPALSVLSTILCNLFFYLFLDGRISREGLRHAMSMPNSRMCPKLCVAMPVERGRLAI